MPAPNHIAKAFDRIAADYDRFAALEQEVGRRLLDRTSFKRLEPARILDLGCGTGNVSAALKKSFRKAQVLALDLSPAMLSGARRKSGLARPLRLICADMAHLPLAGRSVDMVVANLSMFWAPPEALFAEIRRVLRPGGMFLFTGFGQDSLAQLATTLPGLDSRIRFPGFPDLLETGDALTAAGFREPVMDSDRITLQYPSLDALMTELEGTGSALLVEGWAHWKKHREALQAAWQPLLADGKYPLTFEVVYGAAFGPEDGQPLRTAQGEVATFSVDALLKSRGMGYS